MIYSFEVVSARTRFRGGTWLRVRIHDPPVKGAHETQPTSTRKDSSPSETFRHEWRQSDGSYRAPRSRLYRRIRYHRRAGQAWPDVPVCRVKGTRQEIPCIARTTRRSHVVRANFWDGANSAGGRTKVRPYGVGFVTERVRRASFRRCRGWRGRTSGLPTNRPEPHDLRFPELPLRRYRSSGRALLGRRMGAISKTPTASNSVVCCRVELHPGAKPTRHSGADSRTAKDLACPCGGPCSRWHRWRNGNGKSDGNRRILLPSQRSESAGAVVPATPGNLAHTNELRGIPLAARGRTPPLSLHSRRRATISGIPRRSGC
jgi:hypothetical protein